jgi:hypothetical protein
LWLVLWLYRDRLCRAAVDARHTGDAVRRSGGLGLLVYHVVDVHRADVYAGAFSITLGFFDCDCGHVYSLRSY